MMLFSMKDTSNESADYCIEEEDNRVPISLGWTTAATRTAVRHVGDSVI
jgi:hypothetical protein